MKTLIAVPCMDQVPAPFSQALARLEKVGDCVLAMESGSLIYTARNNLAMQAIQMDVDYVFWLDSDMVFPPDTLKRMLNTLELNNLDILTGVYYRRVPPFSPVLFDKLDIRREICSWTEFHGIPDGLFEVGGCGFGCVLMKAEVFLDVQSKHGNCFAPIANNGEDIAFCWRARDCGFHIWADPSIKLGHVGYQVVDENYYKAFKETRNNGNC